MSAKTFAELISDDLFHQTMIFFGVEKKHYKVLFLIEKNLTNSFKKYLILFVEIHSFITYVFGRQRRVKVMCEASCRLFFLFFSTLYLFQVEILVEK